MACTGAARVKSRSARANQSSSIMDSTSAVAPTFRKVGHLGQVGVAHDDVQPPVLLGVAVGLVAGVDDGPLERGLEPDLLLEEVGPLGELEGDVDAAGRRRLGARPCRPR